MPVVNPHDLAKAANRLAAEARELADLHAENLVLKQNSDILAKDNNALREGKSTRIKELEAELECLKGAGRAAIRAELLNELDAQEAADKEFEYSTPAPLPEEEKARLEDVARRFAPSKDS